MSSYLVWEGVELDPKHWQGIKYLSEGVRTNGRYSLGGQDYAYVIDVHLAQPHVGMSERSLRIEGGRSRPILAPRIVLVSDNIPTNIISIGFRERGDHSIYLVRLLDGGKLPLHPFFSEATFQFFVDCETGDCRPRDQLPLRAASKPLPVDTSQKDFRGFLRMLSDWVRVTNPDWTDLAPASLEATLTELLAHHGDMLSYYQDRVANEAFLDTATQRHSLRQHATFFGYPVFEGKAASTLLSFETSEALFVPEGYMVRNRRLHDEREVVFHVTERTLIEPANNTSKLNLAAWPGAHTAVVPRGSDRLLLWGQGSRLRKGMTLVFDQGSAPQVVRLSQVRPLDLPGWVEKPADTPDQVSSQKLVEIQFEPPLHTALRPWDPNQPLRLHANLTPARHGDRRVAWIRPLGQIGTDEAVQQLTERNSIMVAMPRQNGMDCFLRAVEVPEGPVLYDDGGWPLINLTVQADRWCLEENLLDSRSFDLHYIAATDNAGRLWLQFGDEVHGRAIRIDPLRRLPEMSLRMEYWVGEPLDGNCTAHTLSEQDPSTRIEAIIGVTNVIPGQHGLRKDSLDEIRQGIPDSLRHGHLERAVALVDYSTLAKEVRGVSRAVARPLGPPFNTVLVLVDAADEAGLSSTLRERVWEHLEDRRMAGREHRVEAAEYVPLRVELALCVQPGFLRHEVRDHVLAELRPGTDRQRGYFHPDRLSFGQDLEASELMAFVQAIPGVRSVKITAFCRLRNITVTVQPRIVLASTEVPLLEADEDYPEYGVLRVEVVGLDPVDESIYSIDAAPDPEAAVTPPADAINIPQLRSVEIPDKS